MTHLNPPTGLGWLVYKTLHGGDAVSEETLAAGWRALSEARRTPYEAAGAAVDRASRRDERAAIVKMLRVAGARKRAISDCKAPGLINAAELVETVAALAPMFEARNTEGVE